MNTSNIETHLSILGHRVEDRITDFTGVVTSVGFDLYGCVQGLVNPGLDKQGNLVESQWFDIARLKITSVVPVMDTPDFELGPAAEGKKGPAEKPRVTKP